MRIAMALLAASLVIGSAACKKKDKTAANDMGSGSAVVTDTGSGSAGSAMAGSGEGSGSAMAGSGEGSGSAMAGSAAPTEEKMSKRGGNCPSTVAGSTTKADLKGGKIILTISATDKDAIASIQKRAAEVLKEKSDGAPSGTSHDQKGSKGGSQGLCPVHLGEGGTATSKADKKGVVITITPKDKPEELKTEIDGRITKAAEWVKANIKEGDEGTSGGVGGGKGEHGSNHSGEGDAQGKDRKGGDGKGGGEGKGGGGGAGTGGGSQTGSAAGSATK